MSWMIELAPRLRPAPFSDDIAQRGEEAAMNFAGMDLNLLVVLDALLEERHVTRAGQRVGLSQPATSSALARLRHLFGDPLLEREGRRMRLTERAHLMQAPLREALAGLRKVVDAPAAFDPRTAAFSVEILASDQMAFVFLPALRERMKERAPNVDLVFRWTDRARSYDLLADQDIDFAIGVYGDAPLGVRRALLFEDEIVVQARRGHPAFSASLTLERFLQYPRVVVSFEGRLSNYIETALGRAGVSSRSEVVVAHLLAAPLATWDSDLLTIVPVRLARRLSTMLDLDWRPAPFPIPPLPIELLWHMQADRDPALAWFRSQLLEVAALV